MARAYGGAGGNARQPFRGGGELQAIPGSHFAGGAALRAMPGSHFAGGGGTGCVARARCGWSRMFNYSI